MTTDSSLAPTDPAATPPAPKPALATHVADFLFKISVVFFLLAGLAIVVGQIVTMIQGDSVAARSWKADLAPWAFGGASVAGAFAFLLSYRRHVEKAPETPADHADHLG